MMSPGRVSSPVIVSLAGPRSTSFARPKSSTFARPSRVIEDVRRLDVAMDDAARVRRVERRGDLRGILERRGHRQRPCRDERVEPGAVHQLHRDERRAAVLVDLVDRDDVRVVEGGGGAGFLDEAAVAIGIGRRFGRQHLDRHRSPEPRVVRGIDDAHPAAADLGVDAIVGDLIWH